MQKCCAHVRMAHALGLDGQQCFLVILWGKCFWFLDACIPDVGVSRLQAAALEGFAARLSDLTASAAAALEVLTAQLQATHSRTDAAASARGSVMEALAYASNANAVRNELRDLEDACLGQLQAALAALADTQRNSRAALAAAGELALNLTRSEAVAGAARAQAALLQLHMELAVKMQVCARLHACTQLCCPSLFR